MTDIEIRDTSWRNHDHNDLSTAALRSDDQLSTLHTNDEEHATAVWAIAQCSPWTELTKQRVDTCTTADRWYCIEAPVSFAVSDGCIVTWNKGAEALFGYTAEEVIGRDFGLLVPPELPDCGRSEVFRRILEDWPACEHEAVQLTKAGERVPVAITAARLLASDGRAAGVSVTFRDLRPCRAAEAADRAAEACARLALRAGGLVAWEIEVETGRIVADEDLGSLFGVPTSALDGTVQPFIARVHPEDRGRVLEEFAAVAAVGGAYRVEFRVQPSVDREEERWLLGVGEGVVGPDGRVRVVGYNADITASKRTEAALRESEMRAGKLRAELLHVSRLSAAGQMASALAHELNQPLTAIASSVAGALHLLHAASGSGAPNEVALPARAIEAMTRAVAQSLRAGQIVRRLREFVVRGEAETRPEDTCTLIEETGTLALVGARERGIGVSLRLEPDLPCVLVDRIQIQQVLLNLIRNAIEAMTADGVAGGVAPQACRHELLVTAASTSPGMVEVSVADTGAGLAPGIVDCLFEPFVSTKPGGMGVGLSICRSIIEAHNGQLWAEPNPGGGTVFRFTLTTASDTKADGR